MGQNKLMGVAKIITMIVRSSVTFILTISNEQRILATTAHSPYLFLFFQIRRGLRSGSKAEERDAWVDGNAKSLAERAQEEPISHQGREDHAGDHHEDDTDAGVHVVRERPATAQEGEQDDVGAQEQDGRRRRRRAHGLRG